MIPAILFVIIIAIGLVVLIAAFRTVVKASAFAIAFARLRREARVVRRSTALRRCLACGYELRKLSPDSTCPECGKPRAAIDDHEDPRPPREPPAPR